ncbi:sigma-54-dependent Fis family transcriptional regulator [Roseibacillus ishigakijimensis]|uniref:DNA-binding transcriptional regulator NtrC n=1 Tax=Roseibacillus ishigakijimensis TaxID=454146 RepID=A0A934RLS6_9BACT|nr:sigma-54-dependent Fis family transcriptional regulator [Roseibacillus ishigakijimensis]
MAESIEMILGKGGEGHEVVICADGALALELATQNGAGAEGRDFDLVLTAFRLPGMGGMELLQKLRAEAPHRPVILMSANANTELAIEATKQGAYDYLVRPFDAKELVEVVSQGLRASRTMGKRIEMGSAGTASGRVVMLGRCAAMRKVYKEIGRFAPTTATVLIQGETGTGKELVARALFQHSERADRPFVAVNCGAIPDNLLESELFGHVRGAFTGAVANRVGRFQQADGGTLFLDEIGDLPMPVQVKLLRVLQEGVFQQLGSTTDIRVDVRVLAATHQSLTRLIGEGQFREDLYYRINTATILLPPLRERGDDVAELLEEFADVAARKYQLPRPDFSPAALEKLLAHSWPGNARELNNVVSQLVVRSRGFSVSPEQVAFALAGLPEEPEKSGEDFALAILAPVRLLLEEARDAGAGKVHEQLVSELEKQLITTALELSGGHLGKVSAWLGISRVTLRKKIGLYEIEA